MKKKIGLILSAFLIIISTLTNVNAEEKEKVKVYMFRGEGCGYCASALEFFDSIEEEYGEYFKLITYETWNDQDNKKLMDKVAKVMNDNVTGVPYIIIGNKTYNGFSKEAMGEEIIELIKSEYEKDVEDRYDVIAVANQPVKRNLVADIAVVGVIIVIVIVIIVLRMQNKEVIEQEKVKEIKTKKVEKEEKVEENKIKKETTKKQSTKKSEKKEKTSKKSETPKSKK